MSDWPYQATGLFRSTIYPGLEFTTYLLKDGRVRIKIYIIVILLVPLCEAR